MPKSTRISVQHPSAATLRRQSTLAQVMLRGLSISLLSAGVAFANPESAESGLTPIDDQILQTGQLFSMLINTRDIDGERPSLTAEQLPQDAVLLENLDGSSTFMWVPDDEDIGDHKLVLRLADATDPAASLQQSVTLTIATDNEDYQQLQKAVMQTAATQKSSRQSELTLQTSAFPSVDNSRITDVQIIDAEPLLAGINTATQTSTSIVVATVGDSALDAVQTDVEKVTSESAPIMVLEDQFTLVSGSYFEYTFVMQANTQSKHEVRVLNRPTGLEFTNNNDKSFTLHWLPTHRDIGTTRLIVQVTDTEANEIVFSERLKVFVKLP